jgi:hypothetical protein
MDQIEILKQKIENHKQLIEIEIRNTEEMKKAVPKDLVLQFLQNYKAFVNKFFGDMTVKTIRWDDKQLKFVEKEIICNQSWHELLNTVDRFYNSEKYWSLDPFEKWPNIRVWVEKQDILARLEGY